VYKRQTLNRMALLPQRVLTGSILAIITPNNLWWCWCSNLHEGINSVNVLIELYVVPIFCMCMTLISRIKLYAQHQYIWSSRDLVLQQLNKHFGYHDQSHTWSKPKSLNKCVKKIASFSISSKAMYSLTQSLIMQL